MFIDASCCVPQMKSLAGVAANTKPFPFTRSPWLVTSWIAVLPDLAIDPSRMLKNPSRIDGGKETGRVARAS
jgi:hypothetical protein